MNRFEQHIIDNDITCIQLLQTDESTSTAQDAANTHNIPLSNIVKSLLIYNENSNTYEIYLVPGDKKLDLDRVGGRMANAQEVKEVTGYSIGGVPPFGHKNKLKINIEEGFDKEKTLLAAGGKPNVVFKVTYERLVKICSN